MYIHTNDSYWFIYVQVGCTADEFQCDSGYGCLDQSLLCDTQPQCLHGSDEFGCGMWPIYMWEYREELG